MPAACWKIHTRHLALLEVGDVFCRVIHKIWGKTRALYIGFMVCYTRERKYLPMEHYDFCEGEQPACLNSTVDEEAAFKDKLNRLLSEMTGQPLEVIERDTDRDTYMTAREAQAYSIVDHVGYPK